MEMKPLHRVSSRFLLFAVIVVLISSKTVSAPSLNVAVDKNTVVRFFFLPARDYYHPALLFRVVGLEDPRLNTAPMSPEGRAVFVSQQEMQELVRRLYAANLCWKKSELVEIPEPIRTREITSNMEVKLFSSTGTAQALISRKRICGLLEPLDSALKQPRAIWEFQLFRTEYGCRVPNFNREAYPEHDRANESIK